MDSIKIHHNSSKLYLHISSSDKFLFSSVKSKQFFKLINIWAKKAYINTEIVICMIFKKSIK